MVRIVNLTNRGDAIGTFETSCTNQTMSPEGVLFQAGDVPEWSICFSLMNQPIVDTTVSTRLKI